MRDPTAVPIARNSIWSVLVTTNLDNGAPLLARERIDHVTDVVQRDASARVSDPCALGVARTILTALIVMIRNEVD
jgi:hypothetical protein